MKTMSKIEESFWEHKRTSQPDFCETFYADWSEGKLDELSIKIVEKAIHEYKQKQSIQSGLRAFDQTFMDLAEQAWKINPFFYDDNSIFWWWNKETNCYEIIKEIKLQKLLNETIATDKQIINAKVRNEIMQSMKIVGQKHIPEPAPKKWVQFKDTAFSLRSVKKYKVEPNYFFTNPIPWNLGKTHNTPKLDKLFNDWVGEEQVQDLYEMIAYCCYTDYPIQKIFCLYGHGRNGKSTFIKILQKFFGLNNLASSNLDILIQNRFETFNLYKKLACLMGETNFGTMSNTSMLKKLTGGDLIRFEMKGKDTFNDVSYAKLIIATNSLPSSDDTSDGFYRRWHIIDFPNEFPEGRDISLDIPDEEYENLAKKCTLLLPAIIQSGQLGNPTTIEERKNKYVMASNPMPIFVEEFCIKDDANFVGYNELYSAYITFLRKIKRRRVGRKEFRQAIEDEGLFIERTTKSVGEFDERVSGNWVIGIRLSTDWKDKLVDNLKM